MIDTVLSDTETLIRFAIICGATLLFSYFFNLYLKRLILKKSGIIDNDPTNYVFFKHFATAVIYLFGFGWALLTLPIAKTYGHSLLAGAGVTTLIAGFASQQALSNIVGGIFILIFKPFRVNDYIEFQGKSGRVMEVNLHDTIIQDDAGNTIVIPNTLLSNGIITNIKKQP
ncbi:MULTISPECIES: mechanosensitive ion channel domain-containing protein [Flavobacterium]|uniref:mechanosensitive ion channel family protein n=1 Tax=Flavobacterium TaxID=237 RepID=UPI00086831DB|nr:MULTISPECIES: mechanosensitive ion channel domain-containing protein [Flavobacterium]MBN9282956.1 mechanosensitive ion channel [Flavobacterium sp.]ODS78358.1 MAG: hypothetical protein ABS44_21870 [Chryseobacterium sp. SCN 40-13]OJV67591.1 MAG: hypothetical protein BGO42_16290 [Flavobacterium sp. 40-81]